MSNETMTAPRIEVTPQTEDRQGIVSRLRNKVSYFLGMLSVILFVAPSARAATATDPLSGGGDGIFTTLQSYLSGSLVAKVFALAVVSIAIGLVLRWVRKAVHA